MNATNSIRIRRAARSDCGQIADIYNDAVLKTTASYDYEPRPLEYRLSWFDAHQQDELAIFVAEESLPEQVTRVIGWSALNRYHDRIGYRFTAENSVYVAESARGKGLGSRLLEPLLPAARERGLHAIIAAIDAANEPSLRLHARFGFEKVGHFREVGFKFGRWLDVVYLQLRLEGSPAAGSGG